MAKKMDRRSFIKNSTAVGVGTLIGSSAFFDLRAASTAVDISVVKGRDYFKNTIKAVEQLGGMKKFVPRNAKVALLINSSFKHPGSIVNPTVGLAVVKMCFAAGAKEICCIPGPSQSYWHKSPLAQKFKDEIEALKPAGRHVDVEIRGGKSLKKAEVAKGLLECDVFIDVPIVKDHEGTRFTCTLKNLMGACPYSTNRFFHYGSGAKRGYDDIDFLSQCIADLNLIKKPHLCVVDATEFITANGPSGPGPMKKAQQVVAGTDRVLVDTYCSAFLGLEAKNVAMIAKAHAHGLGSMDLKKAKIKEITV